jgi:hypothetical protein
MKCGSKKKTYAKRTHNNFQVEECPVVQRPGLQSRKLPKEKCAIMFVRRGGFVKQFVLLIQRRYSIQLFRQLAQLFFGKYLAGIATIAQAARAKVTSDPVTEVHVVAQGICCEPASRTEPDSFRRYTRERLCGPRGAEATESIIEHHTIYSISIPLIRQKREEYTDQ